MSMSRRRTVLIASVVGALVAGGLVTAQAASAATGCRVDYVITSQWPGAFGANVTVTNLGDPIAGWQLTWTFNADQRISQAWNATVVQSAAAVTATNLSYNAVLATNGSAYLGFNAYVTGSNLIPTAFTLNGVGCTGAVVATSPAPSQTPRCAGPATPSPAGPELVYVTNLFGPVTAYGSGSSGAVAPARSLADPQVPDTYWGPWGIAFDGARNAYVQTFLSEADTFVYPPGGSTPCRIFRVAWPDSQAIAVDSAGYEYVLTGQSDISIAVAAPAASGTADNLYSVPMVRQIPIGTTSFRPWPGTLAMGPNGQLVTGVVGSDGNAVQFFSGGPGSATGTTGPIRVLSGPHTGLGVCSDPCDQLAVAYSAYTGRLYVAVSQGQQTHINIYSGNVNGDVLPLTTISGPATGLAGQVITGIAVSQVDGSIYVLAKSSEFSATSANILVFDRLASGNVAPKRTFTDASTGLQDGMGIAISR